MASKEEYARWIVANQSKKGTPEFETVRQAYEKVKQDEARASSRDPAANEAAMIKAKHDNPWLGFQSWLGRNLPEARSISGNPAYRAVAGVADLPVGAAQFAANVTGLGDETMNNFVNKRESMIREGREHTGSDGVDWPRLGGQLTSGIVLGRKLPSPSTLRGKVATGAAEGAAFGVAMPTEGEDRPDVLKSEALSGSLGAVFGGALPAVIAGSSAVAQKVGSMMSMSPESTARRLGRALREMAGKKSDDVVRELEANPNEISAGMASVNAAAPGIAAFDDMIARRQGVRLDEREALNQHRQGLLSFAGDSKSLADAIRNRSAIPKDFLENPAYLTTDVRNILARNAVKDVVPAARKMAEDEVSNAAGNPRFEGHIPSQYVARFLQNVKLGLDAKLNGVPDSSLDQIQRGQVLAAKNELVEWMKKNVPRYEEFRSDYASQSVPIDRMKIAQALRGRLAGPMSNYADDSAVNGVNAELPDILRQRAQSFEQGLQNEAATIRAASGRQVYKHLSDLFTPEQIGNMKQVSDSLNREARLRELVREGTTLADQELNDMNAPQMVRMLERTVFIANSVLKKMGDKQIADVLDLYASVRNNPAEVARIMRTSPNAPAIANVIKAMEFIGKHKTLGPQISGILANEVAE